MSKHTIILMQTTPNKKSRTYDEFETVALAMDGAARVHGAGARWRTTGARREGEGGKRRGRQRQRSHANARARAGDWEETDVCVRVRARARRAPHACAVSLCV